MSILPLYALNLKISINFASYIWNILLFFKSSLYISVTFLWSLSDNIW